MDYVNLAISIGCYSYTYIEYDIPFKYGWKDMSKSYEVTEWQKTSTEICVRFYWQKIRIEYFDAIGMVQMMIPWNIVWDL